MDLTQLTLGEMLAVHSTIGLEMKARGVARTGNNPCADFAEYLVAQSFRWQLNPNSKAGFDAFAKDGQRIEIKARRLAHSKSSRQASAIRKIDEKPFDRLIAILFAADYSVLMAADIPYEVIRARCSHVEHTNSDKFYIRDDLLAEPGVINITKKLRTTAEKLLSLK